MQIQGFTTPRGTVGATAARGCPHVPLAGADASTHSGLRYRRGALAS